MNSLQPDANSIFSPPEEGAPTDLMPSNVLSPMEDDAAYTLSPALEDLLSTIDTDIAGTLSPEASDVADLDRASLTPEEDQANLENQDGEDQQTATQTPPIGQMSLITDGLSADSVIVETYADLKSVLENDNGYNKIYFANDIDGSSGSSGIFVHQNKQDLLISGDDPRTTGVERFTYYERSSTSTTGGIYLSSNNSSIGTVTFENMIVMGANPCGTCYVPPGSATSSVLMIFRNVDYIGPQIVHHRNGTVEFDNMSFVSDPSRSPSKAQDMGEVNKVVFKNTVDLTFIPTATSSLFWFFNSDNSITVEENANVTIEIDSSKATYVDFIYGNNCSLEVKSGACFIVLTDSEISSYSTARRISPLYVRSGAHFEVQQTGNSNRTYSLAVAGELLVEEGATFICQRRNTAASYASLYLDGGASLHVTNPARFVVSHAGSGSAPRAIATSANTPFSLTADVVNLWYSAASFPSETGLIRNLPDVIWNKRNLATPVTLSTRYTSAGAVSGGTLSHNMSPTEDPWYYKSLYPNSDPAGIGLPNDSTMALSSIFQIVAGDHTLLETATSSSQVRVATVANADLRLDYDSATIQIDGMADATGKAALSPSGGATFPLNDTLYLFSRWDSLTAYTDFSDSSLRFEEPPPSVNFGTLSPVPVSTLCQRVNPVAFSFSIYDGRATGGQWSVRVQAADHLHCSGPFGTDRLEYALVFGVLDSGSGTYIYDTVPVGTGELAVAQGSNTGPGISVCTWDANQGLLLMLPAGHGLVGETYSAELNWFLYDTP